jgi:hypothetical protein
VLVREKREKEIGETIMKGAEKGRSYGIKRAGAMGFA